MPPSKSSAAGKKGSWEKKKKDVRKALIHTSRRSAEEQKFPSAVMWIVPPRLPHYPSKHTQALCQIRPAKKISQGLVISLRDNSAIIEFLPPPPYLQWLVIPHPDVLFFFSLHSEIGISAFFVPPRCVECIFEWSFNRFLFLFFFQSSCDFMRNIFWKSALFFLRVLSSKCDCDVINIWLDQSRVDRRLIVCDFWMHKKPLIPICLTTALHLRSPNPPVLINGFSAICRYSANTQESNSERKIDQIWHLSLPLASNHDDNGHHLHEKGLCEY